jgi:predicted MFS family arabinose efflux permease
MSGFFSLAIVMGIGRFAYTPIFPYMQTENLLTPFSAGLLATFNYVGYFLGALGARYISYLYRWFFIGIVLNILTTLLMGWTEWYSAWILFRFLSGYTSGLVFVLTSLIILSKLNQSGKMYYSGLLYGGVGFGILLSGSIIPTLHSFGGWQGSWGWLGLLCFLFFILIAISLTQVKSEPISTVTKQKSIVHLPNKKMKRALYISYTCEGFGYIIFGTFITGMLVDNAGFTFNPSYIWAMVGLGAIPSCMLWATFGNKTSNIKALKFAYIAQIISILIPVFTDNLLLIIISALGFGGTFMGITTLTMNIARSLDNSNPNLISGLTASYGVGQILGPIVAGTVISANDYVVPFVISAVVLLAALINIIQIHSSERGISNAVRKY